MEAVPKIEGHATFYTHLKNGHVDKARIIGLENDRFVEKILLGRKYWEAPIITSRICGICPTIHNITSTKAIENACGIRSSKQTIKLRELMLAAQMIQSHSLHLYLLVLPDYVGASSSFELQKSHPGLFRNAIALKKYADNILEVIGGRAVHPITNAPGGFKSLPTKENLKKLLDSSEEIIQIGKETIQLFASFDYPEFKRELIYSALHNKSYSPYDGEIWTSNGDIFKTEQYNAYIYEELKPYTRAKFGTLKGKEMMVGSIARISLNKQYLSDETQEIMKDLKIAIPLNNPFQNIVAQALENYHFAIKSNETIQELLDSPLKNESLILPDKFGVGVAACEAPRGTLFHYYELDKDGNIIKCDIITPTVKSLTALEFDLKEMEPVITGKKLSERNMLIEKLIRAYDPCITCATH